MPNRIIREGWLESEPINSLDPRVECFFLRLCLRADDFGRYHANPVLLKSNLFPLREDVRSTDIPRYLAACEKAGLVRCYQAEAKAFLEIVKFGQRIKDGAKSKFPPPPESAGTFPENPGKAGTFPPYSESESGSESKTNAIDAPGGAPGDSLPLGIEPTGELILPGVLATDAFRAKWTEYLVYRRERRLPKLVPTSIARQLQKLAGFGHDGALAALDETISNSWTGVFEPKARQRKPRASALPDILTDADVERINRSR